MNSKGKKIISAMLALCIMLISVPSYADEPLNEPVDYLVRSWNGKEIVESTATATKYNIIDSETVYLQDNETYVLNDNVQVSEIIECGKNVNLILTADNVLSAGKGIKILGEGSLNIYDQKDSYSTIIAKNDDFGAGIDVGKGILNVYGGAIDGIADMEKAGINLDGGTINIYGGDVRGNSLNGAGIGGSEKGNGGTINIYDGYVSGNSYYGAGIGSGESGKNRNITINGGRVTGFSTYGGGIGSGVNGTCGTVTFNFGNILGFSSSGYAFHGCEVAGEPAGKTPNICIGENVSLYYGETQEELNRKESIVTSKTRDISKVLTNKRYIVMDELTKKELYSASAFSTEAGSLAVGFVCFVAGLAVGILIKKKKISDIK